MEKIKIEGLYEAAYRAYSNISFDPEKRAAQTVKDYEEELNVDIELMPESEQERYIQGYKTRLFAFLLAKSRTLSSMITGPANFPAARNRKALDVEVKRLEEFFEWRTKALKSIARKIEEAKPEEQKNAERWTRIKTGLESSMRTVVEIDTGVNRYSSRLLIVNSIIGLVRTLAKNGETDLVNSCLNLIRDWNKHAKKPIISEKNSVWTLVDVSIAQSEKIEAKQTADSEESEINGVRIVRNQQADRLQLFFKGKPSPEMISKLKHSAFKWSPSNGCWQRQLTSNAIYAANNLLSSYVSH